VIPANVGVNPSLTITALAEHAMSHVPPAGSASGATTPSAARLSREGDDERAERSAGGQPISG
jgi:cholesterol oxidase